MFSVSSLKALTRRMVDCIGSQEKAGHICGVSQVRISNWCSDGHRALISVIPLLKLNQASGDLFLHDLAHHCGCALMPSRSDKANSKSIINTIASFSKAAGNLECITLQAEEDGTTCPREKREIRDAIAPVKDDIAKIERAIA